MLIGRPGVPIRTLLVAAALIFVRCSESNDPTQPVDPLVGAALCLSDQVCGVCPEGDSSTIIEVTNCGNSTVLEWSASESSEWFSLSAAAGTTPGSFTVTADTNRSAATRSGRVIITARGLADAAETLLVSQPLVGSVVHLSLEAWTAAAASDTSELVQVTNIGNASLMAWSVSSDSSWLAAIPANGLTPGDFKIVADSNRSGAERIGTVMVTGTGMTDPPATVAVTQATLQPTLRVSLTEWEAYAAGEETGTISVTNCGDVSSFAFQVTETEDWLTLSAAGGSTPGSFTITAATNDTEEFRTGTVTVTAEGVADSPWQITVDQECVVAPVGSCPTPGDAHSVFVFGNYAYVADGNSGLRVIEISDPTDPTETGSFDTPGYACDVFVTTGYAYVADEADGGLQIIKIFDASHPSFVGSYDTPGEALGVHVLGDYVYVADGTTGLRIISISDRTHPISVGSFFTPGYAYDVHVSGDYACVADYQRGLRIIDISHPSSPTSVGSFDTPGYAFGVHQSGDYAYVADGNLGLRVIDVSVPSNPTSVGDIDTPGYACSVAISGDYAFVADFDRGLQIIDISDPADPVLVESYDTPGFARGVYVSGGYAYVADAEGGLLILKLGL